MKYFIVKKQGTLRIARVESQDVKAFLEKYSTVLVAEANSLQELLTKPKFKSNSKDFIY